LINVRNMSSQSPLIPGSTAELDPTVLLTRLSQKPGVQSTLILDQRTGAIVRSSGLLSSTNNNASVMSTGDANPGVLGNEGSTATSRTAKVQTTAEEYAGLVWGFVQAAGGLVKGLDGEVRCLL
jgi:dynein light chain roadblock-type